MFLCCKLICFREWSDFCCSLWCSCRICGVFLRGFSPTLSSLLETFSCEVESRGRRVISGHVGASGTIMVPSFSEPCLTWIHLMLRIRRIISYVLLEFLRLLFFLNIWWGCSFISSGSGSCSPPLILFPLSSLPGLCWSVPDHFFICPVCPSLLQRFHLPPTFLLALPPRQQLLFIFMQHLPLPADLAADVRLCTWWELQKDLLLVVKSIPNQFLTLKLTHLVLTALSLCAGAAGFRRITLSASFQWVVADLNGKRWGGISIRWNWHDWMGGV